MNRLMGINGSTGIVRLKENFLLGIYYEELGLMSYHLNHILYIIQ